MRWFLILSVLILMLPVFARHTSSLGYTIPIWHAECNDQNTRVVQTTFQFGNQCGRLFPEDVTTDSSFVMYPPISTPWGEYLGGTIHDLKVNGHAVAAEVDLSANERSAVLELPAEIHVQAGINLLSYRWAYNYTSCPDVCGCGGCGPCTKNKADIDVLAWILVAEQSYQLGETFLGNSQVAPVLGRPGQLALRQVEGWQILDMENGAIVASAQPGEFVPSTQGLALRSGANLWYWDGVSWVVEGLWDRSIVSLATLRADGIWYFSLAEGGLMALAGTRATTVDTGHIYDQMYPLSDGVVARRRNLHGSYDLFADGRLLDGYSIPEDELLFAAGSTKKWYTAAHRFAKLYASDGTGYGYKKLFVHEHTQRDPIKKSFDVSYFDREQGRNLCMSGDTLVLWDKDSANYFSFAFPFPDVFRWEAPVGISTDQSLFCLPNDRLLLVERKTGELLRVPLTFAEGLDWTQLLNDWLEKRKSNY